MKAKVTNKSTYSIFISYRRDGGFETANLIAEKLRNAGYNVFFDVESLRSGKFNEQLFRVIENCKDFIIILPKDGLDRCTNETDWVKQEVVHAMKYKKNIVPVMLSDFKWPEAMPAGLEGLEHYQSIAAGSHEYFDAAVDKLKSYLQAKRGFSWHKYKTYIVGLLLLLSLTAGLFLWHNYKERQYFTQRCIEQTNLMSVGIANMNHNLNIARSAHDEWGKFRNKLSRVQPQEIPTVKQEFVAWIENQKNSIQRVNPELKISNETATVLNRYNIKTSEIIAFYSIALPHDIEDAIHYLDQLQVYANDDYIADIYDKFVRLNYQFLEASGKSTYYYFLGLLTTMPKEVYKDFYKMQQYLNNFSEIPLNLSYDEYESKGDAMLRNAEQIVMEMGSIVNTEDRDVEDIQNQLKEIKEFMAMEQQQQQLQEMEVKIEESFRNIIEDCKLSPNDDQYLMWGKIVHIATSMAQTTARRMETERLDKHDKETAQAKGYDVSNWFSVKYSLTMDEVLQEIITRLDQYMKYFPDTKNYIPAVKQFYTNVKDGKQPLNGMVVIGTKDDIPHPIFKIGDIVLSRKDKTVNSTTDYKSVAKTERDDTVVFLRLHEGKLQKHTEVVPETEVLIGFLVLKEENK
ncbi:MAG: toll/interleukin-1 receptor domain-containing protein [Bacteroidales bacterium]|nr:toll/interleukin-1 receptor domain-containing protein [Bacteroidales bacterium]